MYDDSRFQRVPASPLVHLPPEAVRFRNDSGETAPAYGVMRCTGMQETVDGVDFVVIAKPSTTFTQHYLINGPLDVANGKSGYGFFAWHRPRRALFDTGSAAAFQTWGPKAGQWALSAEREGFKVYGNRDDVNSTVLVMQEPITTVVGKLDGALAAGSTATLSIWTKTPEIDSSQNLVADDWLLTGDQTLAAGTQVIATFSHGVWYVVGIPDGAGDENAAGRPGGTYYTPSVGANWMAFKNVSAESMPAFGVGKITGTTTVSGLEVLTVDKPDSTLVRHYLVNSEDAVAASALGVGWFDGMARCLYNGGSASFDQGYGPKSGQWSAEPDWEPFALIGGADGTSAIMRIGPINELIGKLDGTLTQGGAQTMSVWTGDPAADSSMNLTAEDWLLLSGNEIASGKKVWVRWMHGIWYVQAAECA